MKKIYNILSVALAIVATASCAKEFNPFAPAKNTEGLVEMTICATRSEATKAELGSTLNVVWSADDSIAVWDGVAKRQFKVSSIEKDGGVAYFKGYVVDSAKTITAVYPESAFVSVVADTLVNVTVPSTQTIKAGQLADPKALVSYAYAAKIDSTKAELSFQNLTSLIRVQVPSATDTLSQIVIKGNASEPLTGALAYATKTGELGASTCSGTTSVTLKSDNDTLGLTQGYYFAAVAPATLSAGVTVVAASAKTMLSTSSTALNLVRNYAVSLGDIVSGDQAVALPSQIGTVEDFLLFSQYCNFYSVSDVVELTADLDFAKVDCSEFIPETYIRYYGSIEGNGHRIYNYTIKSKNGDVSIFPRVGANNAATPTFIRNIAFGTKDYDFATGKGTYDGVSTCTFDILDHDATYYYPGAIAYVYGYTTVENLVNYTPVDIPASCTSRHRAGCLFGTLKNNITAKNCINYGSMTDANTAVGQSPTAAGIAGALDGLGSVCEKCINYGTVTIKSQYMSDYGGVFGYDNYLNTITDCANYGDIIADYTMTKGTYVGGITSRSTKAGSVITNCSNTGKITLNLGEAAQDVFVGGIFGRYYGGTLTNCDNFSSVTVTVTNAGKAVYAGGVLGNICTNVYTADGCDNYGDVTINGAGKCAYAGGVCGYIAKDGTMSNSTNTGAVRCNYASTNANGGAAGIVMFANAKTILNKCVNKGPISVGANQVANTFVGGIAGIFGSVTTHAINDCTNEGTILVGSADQTTEGTAMMVGGGIAGTASATFKGCVNKGEIKTVPGTVCSRYIIGGVLGGSNYNMPAVTDCSNSGKITVDKVSTASWSCVGGVTGIIGAASMTGCSNTGDIVSTAANSTSVETQLYVGGLAGVGAAVAPMPKATVGCTGCSVNCNVTVDASTLAYAGMVLGRNAYATAWSMGTADSPIAVKGALNATAVTADNVKALALGSGNTDAAGVMVTINAAVAAE